MSLLDAFMEPCYLMTETKEADGSGGYTATWTEGNKFNCAITLDTSISSVIAKKDNYVDTYTITTSKDISLGFHAVVKRISDGLTFRITSDGTDRKTPSSAWLDMRQVSAERWDIPS